MVELDARDGGAAVSSMSASGAAAALDALGVGGADFDAHAKKLSPGK